MTRRGHRTDYGSPLGAKVTVDAHGCYLWRGRVNKKGYGWVRVGQRVVPVHREVYARCNERDAMAGMDVHHTCGVRGCVNPHHLVLRESTRHRREALRAYQ